MWLSICVCSYYRKFEDFASESVGENIEKVKPKARHSYQLLGSRYMYRDKPHPVIV